MASPGHDIDGRQFSDKRSPHMSKHTPPKNYRWTSESIGTYEEKTHQAWKDLRLDWLEQYTCVVSSKPEKGYRYWRWLGEDNSGQSAHPDSAGRMRRIVWWERRPWDDPLPTTPGLWPAND